MPIRVNGEEIPEQAINYELARLMRFYAAHMSAEEIRNQREILRQKAKDQAIGAKLLIEEAERLDIRVPEDDVESRLLQMKESAGGASAFEKLLTTQGIPESVVRDSIRRGHRVDLLVEKITEGISDPTEEEMRAHFEQHSQEYRKPPRAQAQHILIKADPGQEQDRHAARSKLREIREQLEAGADFSEMAAAHSQCPSGRKTGGSLGWFSRGMMVPELDDVVFSMEAGTLSDVVETPLGYHLIRKIDQEDGGEATYEEVADKIREFLRHSRRGDVISAYVEELKGRAVIEEDG